MRSAILRVGRCGECGRRVTNLRGGLCGRCEAQREADLRSLAAARGAAARVDTAFAVLRAARSADTEAEAYERVAALLGWS